MPVIPAAQLAYLRDQRPRTARVEWFVAVAPYGNACFQARVDEAGWADERGEMDVGFDAGSFGNGLDIQQGVLAYNPVANSFQDTGQDFSQWQTTANDALYVIVVINNDATITWAFLGADFTTANPNDSILVYQDSELATAGWCGTAPGGKVAIAYSIHVAPNAGMTLWIDGSGYDAYGVGRVRVRSVEGNAVNGVNGTLHVAENSEIEWTDDDYLTCPGAFGFRELWGVYPRLTESGGTVDFFMDYDRDFTDPQDTIIPPKANAGPPAVQWITGGNADIPFTGDRSYTTEIGAAIASYLWNRTDAAVVAGALNAAGSCAVPNTLRWTTAGFRYVPLDVTDNTAQARTARHYAPTWIFDEGAEDPYRLAEVSSQEGDADSGWRARLKVFRTDSANEDIIYNFPDGALVVVFTRTWYGGTETGVGGWCMASDEHYRDNVRFVGWLLGETLEYDYAAGTVEFEAVGHDGVMRLIPGWPFTIEDIDGTPTDWYEVADLNVDRALHYLLEFYSTVNQVCHVERVGEGNARPVKIQSYPDASLYDQAQDHLLIDAKCLLLADRQGVLYATQDPQFLDAAGRGGVDVACHLQEAEGDWLNDMDEGRAHRSKVGMARLGGFAYDEPLLSLAPGDAPVQSGNELRVDGCILQDQTEANLWSGLQLTRANLDYPQVPVELTGYWPVFDPAYQEYVELTVTDPLGRVAWTQEKFVVRGVSFEDRGADGTAITTLTLEKASAILTGQTEEVPEPSTSSPTTPSYPVSPPTWGGDLTHVILMTTQGVLFTESFDEESPVWYAANAGLAVAERTGMRDVSFDYNHGSRLFLVTDNGLGGAFACQDVWNSAAWALGGGGALDYMWPVNQIDTCGDPVCNPVPATCRGAMDGGWWAVNCDPTTGYLEFIAGYDFPCAIAGWAGGGCRLHKRAFFSGDALASCTMGDYLLHDPPVLPLPDCGNNHCSTPEVGNISSSGGWSLYTYVCAWGAGGDDHRGLSTNGGQEVDTSVGQMAAWSSEPLWHARAGAEVIFWVSRVGNLDIWYSSDHGATFAAVGGGGTLPVPAEDYKHALAMHNLNTSNLMYIDTGGTLRVSTDQGATWGVPSYSPSAPECVQPAMVSGYPEGEAFVVGCDQAVAGEWIYLTWDLGATEWLNKTGNLDTWLGAGDTIEQIICVQEGLTT